MRILLSVAVAVLACTWVAAHSERLQQCWEALGSVDFAVAESAYRELVAAGEGAVPFLKERIRGVAIPAVDLKRLHALVQSLDDKDFKNRQKAANEICEYGELAVGPLQQLVERKTSLEAQQRARKLLAEISVPSITPERLRAFEGVGVLQAIGSKQAQAALAELARDSLVPLLRNEATRALKQLQR